MLFRLVFEQEDSSAVAFAIQLTLFFHDFITILLLIILGFRVGLQTSPKWWISSCDPEHALSTAVGNNKNDAKKKKDDDDGGIVKNDDDSGCVKKDDSGDG